METVPSETLAERLFSGGDFAFRLGIQRPRQEWFQWSSTGHEALQERRHWLTTDPDRHQVWTNDAAPVLQEVWSLFRDTPDAPESMESPTHRAPAPMDRLCDGDLPKERLTNLSLHWEPDLLLLRRDTSGEFRLVAGAVCFPSAWDLREKIGKTVDTIHASVPTLNATLGSRIRTFLDRLPPGQTFERDNWGLAALGERNAHPDRGLPRLTPAATLDSTWLRLEHQAFRILPESRGLLFAIHLTVHPLSQVLRTREDSRRLASQLRSMPDDIAAYKGILPARETLIRQLEQG